MGIKRVVDPVMLLLPADVPTHEAEVARIEADLVGRGYTVEQLAHHLPRRRRGVARQIHTRRCHTLRLLRRAGSPGRPAVDWERIDPARDLVSVVVWDKAPTPLLVEAARVLRRNGEEAARRVLAPALVWSPRPDLRAYVGESERLSAKRPEDVELLDAHGDEVADLRSDDSETVRLRAVWADEAVFLGGVETRKLKRKKKGQDR